MLGDGCDGAGLTTTGSEGLTTRGGGSGFTIGGQSIAEFKRSFRTACKLAGITGLTFHDLRHCATTKMVNAGLPAEHVMAATGHTQSSTFRRYINTDVQRVQNLADALDAMQSREADKTLASPFIN